MAGSDDSADAEKRARQREATRRWRAKNPDHDKTPERREKERQRSLLRYANNLEKERERSRNKSARRVKDLKETNPALYAFEVHKNNARQRNIPFLFTFEEWWMVWESSGKWEQRGVQRGQYVMSRPGDKGPYAPDNVEIILAEQNRSDRGHNYPPTALSRAKMSYKAHLRRRVIRNGKRAWSKPGDEDYPGS